MCIQGVQKNITVLYRATKHSNILEMYQKPDQKLIIALDNLMGRILTRPSFVFRCSKQISPYNLTFLNQKSQHICKH